MAAPIAPQPNTELPPIQRAADRPPGERFVMCPPQYLSTKITNNVWMSGEPVDVPRAMEQYRRVKTVIAAFGVDVLEIPPGRGLQDQTYVANIAVSIDPYIILANYKAPGRAGEVPVAKRFFEGLGYQTIQPPFDFEGEADLKKFAPGVYIGGYGKFTDLRAHHWIAEQTGVTILPVEEVSDELYHLDTSLFVLDNEHLLITQKGLSPASIKALGTVADLVFTPPGIESTGITNGVKIPGKGVYLSGMFNPELAEYRQAMEWMLKTLDDYGYVPLFLDVDESDKSGADLSCQVFHLDFAPQRGRRARGILARPIAGLATAARPSASGLLGALSDAIRAQAPAAGPAKGLG